MADTTTLNPTLQNQTSPTERVNLEVPLEVKWERDLYGEREKSLEEEQQQVPDAFAEWKDIQASFEPIGMREGSLSFNAPEVAENAVDKTVSGFKKLGENVALFGESFLDLGKMTFGAAEYSTKNQPAESPKTEEEQIQEVEFKFTLEKNQNLASSQNIIRQKEEDNQTIRILGAAARESEESKNRLAKKSNLSMKTANSAWDLWRIRNGVDEQKKAAEEAEKEQGIMEVSPNSAANLSGNLLAQEGQSLVANQIVGAG